MLLAFVSSLYAFACLCVIGFQVALICGARWGEITQGGHVKGALPTSGRVLAGVSICILFGMAFAITSQAGWWPGWPAWSGWVALGIQALSCIANWITPSRAERRLWGPITLMMLIMAAVVVVGY